MKRSLSVFVILFCVSIFLYSCSNSQKKERKETPTTTQPDSSDTKARCLGGIIIVIDNVSIMCPPTTTVAPTSARLSGDKKSATVNWTTLGPGTYAVMYKELTGNCTSCTQYQSDGWISQVCPEGTTNTYTLTCLCAEATYDFKVAYFGEDFSCKTQECSCE